MAGPADAPDAGRMRAHPRRPVSVLLAIGLLVLLAGCGGSDASDGASGSSGGGSAAEAGATDGGDDGDGGGEEASGDDGAAAVDVPTSGLSFEEAVNADGLTPEQLSELQINLSVFGLDHAGWVSGSTIVVQTSDDDPDDRQFTCIAAGQVDQEEYEVVVVDEAGEVLDC